MVPLGNWVIREACRQFAAWSAEHGTAAPLTVSVNVSARQLREPGFAAEVASALADAGIAPHRLALEITETTAAGPGASGANLLTLRGLGVQIALDDFGTGQSTLSLLQSCPVDELKLDSSFTQTDPAGHRRTVAAAVIHLADALDLRVVAKGVETAQQAERLRALGYQAAQGYHFARPVPAARVSELVARNAVAA
jgi:EAL domain-containing protein (putative c-di-GMP-specific phosphodiesterase class I)